jgi:hypothetical protein
MMALSIDITPWVIAVAAIGGILGASISRPVYSVFAVLATIFGVYSLTPVFGMPYNMLVSAAWLLSTFFGTASLVNAVAWRLRRIEMQLQMLSKQMDALKLMMEEEK